MEKLMRVTHIAAAVLVAVGIGTGLAHARPGGGPGPNPNRGPKQVVVNGVVKSVLAPGFVLHRHGGGAGSAGIDISIVTDGSTQYLKSDGSAGSFSDVVVDARVQAKGVRNPDGTVLARRLLILPPRTDD
jgi:hypothetical protein